MFTPGDGPEMEVQTLVLLHVHRVAQEWLQPRLDRGDISSMTKEVKKEEPNEWERNYNTVASRKPHKPRDNNRVSQGGKFLSYTRLLGSRISEQWLGLKLNMRQIVLCSLSRICTAPNFLDFMIRVNS